MVFFAFFSSHPKPDSKPPQKPDPAGCFCLPKPDFWHPNSRGEANGFSRKKWRSAEALLRIWRSPVCPALGLRPTNLFTVLRRGG
jgi:hypothetical protein